jgi:hypothetical protein
MMQRCITIERTDMNRIRSMLLTRARVFSPRNNQFVPLASEEKIGARQNPEAPICVAETRSRMTALQHQQLLAQTRFSAINSALGLKIAAIANTRNRNTCAPVRPNPSKSASPATCQR